MPPSPEDRLDVVLSRLEAVRKVRSGYMARCPAHEDQHPSLNVDLGRTTIVLHCWAGCHINSVREALGLAWDDLFYESREPLPETKKRKPGFSQEVRRSMALEAEACAMRLQQEEGVLNRLRQERGWAGKALELLTVGWNGRRLTLLSKDSKGDPHDILLYDPFIKTGRKMLAGQGRSRQPWPAPESVSTRGSEPLYVVEGEGTAISLASLGLPVVALPGSIGKPTYDPISPGSWRGVGWHQSWVSRLQGPHKFVLIPDCDEQGRMLMRAVSYDLERVGEKVIYLDLSPSNATGFDIGDWLKPARDREARESAKLVLQLAVKVAEKDMYQLDGARDMMRAWYKEQA